jgi:hypothetical protein
LIIGYHAGFNIQLPVAPDFFFQPGLLFSLKGSEGSYGILTGTYKLSYIEIPLNLVYKGLLGNGYITLGFGPYIGYGIMGNSTLTVGPVSVETDVEFTKSWSRAMGWQQFISGHLMQVEISFSDMKWHLAYSSSLMLSLVC